VQGDVKKTKKPWSSATAPNHQLPECGPSQWQPKISRNTTWLPIICKSKTTNPTFDRTPLQLGSTRDKSAVSWTSNRAAQHKSPAMTAKRRTAFAAHKQAQLVAAKGEKRVEQSLASGQQHLRKDSGRNHITGTPSLVRMLC
jgi:hypothetical protein